MANTVKRLNYYDHQFLRAPDFTDEQNYHLNMRRLHNSLLHTWGIAQGLAVTATGGGTGTAVTVSAGVALDSTGREIVLPSDQNLELGGQAAGTTLYITITYNEQPSDPTTEAGGPGDTRITELPNLSFSQTPPADKSTTLILARVPRTSTGLGTIDLSDRKQAGVVLGSDLTVNTLTLKKDGVAQANWPVLSSSGANQAALANSSLNLDAQREISFADNGQIRSFDQTHKIVFNRGKNQLELYELGDVCVLTGSGLTEKLRVQAGGNVGIGTTTPPQQLTITGGLGFANQDAKDKKLYSPANGVLEWMTNEGVPQPGLAVSHQGEQRAFINAKGNSYFNGGNVGIGTTSPPQQLTITGGLGFANQNAADKKLYSPADGVLEWMTHDGAGAHALAVSHQGQQRAFINTKGNSYLNGGNVGIGVSSPISDLHMRKDAAKNMGPILTLMNGGGGEGSSAAIDFDGYDTGANPPAFRVQAIDDGSASAHLTFSSKQGPDAKNSLVERLKINSNGKLTSPMWKVTQVMNDVPGNGSSGSPPQGLPKSGNFSSGGGTLVIMFSGSGWGSGVIGMNLLLDGQVKGSARCYNNASGNHRAFSTNFLVLPGVAAGTHTITLQAFSNTTTDFNDFYTVTVLELPF